MHIAKADVWHAFLFTLRHIASAVVIFGVIGFITKPVAQEFVRDAVDDRIKQLESQMYNVQREQAIMGTDIQHIMDAQKDQRTDTRMILQSLQGMRRELRAE